MTGFAVFLPLNTECDVPWEHWKIPCQIQLNSSINRGCKSAQDELSGIGSWWFGQAYPRNSEHTSCIFTLQHRTVHAHWHVTLAHTFTRGANSALSGILASAHAMFFVVNVSTGEVCLEFFKKACPITKTGFRTARLVWICTLYWYRCSAVWPDFAPV